jgi:hypothetical protein
VKERYHAVFLKGLAASSRKKRDILNVTCPPLFEMALVLVRLDHVASRIVNAHYSSVKYWEAIADNLKKAGWSYGCVSAVDSNGRTIWIADAHRDGKRFLVHADELLTAFMELERAFVSTC